MLCYSELITASFAVADYPGLFQCHQMTNKAMDHLMTITCLKGSFRYQMLLFSVLISSIGFVLTHQSAPRHGYFPASSLLSAPLKSEPFEPIAISPAVVSNFPNPGPLPSIFPDFPRTYKPVLSSRCPVNFSTLSSVIDKTASDCFQNFAAVLGNVVCCPQFSSLLHIFLGYYSTQSEKLVLDRAMANYCLKDIINILASRRANDTVSAICSAQSSNLTGGSCPVKDVPSFEKTVNSTKLLEACGTVDPLKECCQPVCQPAIMEAALKMSGNHFTVSASDNNFQSPDSLDSLNDCKGVVYSWLSRKLSLDAANTAFRVLSACKVNKVCPLGLMQPSEVIKACRNTASPSPTCCSTLNNYIAGIEKMLITNKQAIVCATTLGSMLQKGGVMTNLYELCDIDLKDFSVQAYGPQVATGCLLRSLPTDMVFDNASGLTFTCDSSDNILAPWPSSSSTVTSLPFCAEMSLPELPMSQMPRNHGHRGRGGFGFLLSIFSFPVLGMLSY